MTRHYEQLLRDDAQNEGMDKPRSRYQWRGSNRKLKAACDKVIAERRLKEWLGEKEP